MEPQITPSYYTTSDAVISTETVFIVEISLTCKNRVQVRQGPGGIQPEPEVHREPGTLGIRSSLAVDGIRPRDPCRQREIEDFDLREIGRASCRERVFRSV